MSIRDRLAARIAQNTPAGTDVTARTKAIMYNILKGHFQPIQLIDAASLPVCEWDEAAEWIYLGTASSMMVDGFVTPLQHGKSVPRYVAEEMRRSGMTVVPINANAPSRMPSLNEASNGAQNDGSDGNDGNSSENSATTVPIPETVTVKPKAPRRRKPAALTPQLAG